MAVDIVIYHNPECGTSRNALAMIRNAGIEPHVIEYLKTPPSRALLVELIDRAGITPRDLLREKGTPYAELSLSDTSLSDEALVGAPQGLSYGQRQSEQMVNKSLSVAAKYIKFRGFVRLDELEVTGSPLVMFHPRSS